MIFFLFILLAAALVIYGISRYSEKKHWERMDKKFPGKKSSGKDR